MSNTAHENEVTGLLEEIDTLKNDLKLRDERIEALDRLVSLHVQFNDAIKDKLEEKELELNNSADKIISLNANRVHLTTELERLRTFEKEVKQQREADKFMNKRDYVFEYQPDNCDFIMNIGYDALHTNEDVTEKEYLIPDHLTLISVSDISECSTLLKAAEEDLEGEMEQ